jgi:sulfate permease, SulP family
MQSMRSSAHDGASSHWQDAFVTTTRQLGEMFAKKTIGPNVAAGLTVALVALPLNLALALACGLPPAVGLVTGAIAGLASALIGGARLQVTGPEVALAPITLEIVLRHGFEGLLVATFLAGLLQIGLGVSRIGRLVHAIPVPVVGGFLAAVGLIVFDSQLPRFFGLSSEVKQLSQLRGVGPLAAIDPWALGLGVLVVGAVLVAPRIRRSLPGPLLGLGLAVAVATIVGSGVPRVQAIESISIVPALPAFGRVDLVALLPEALALALLASIDSLLCAISIDARTGDRVRTDQELVAQGLSNMLSACVGGMPVAAAVVRSAAAVDAGATTRLAPIVQSVALAGVLLLLAPHVSVIPLVALAGILLVVGARLIDWKLFSRLWSTARIEAWIFLTTAAGILFADFVIGVLVGVVAALVHFAFVQRSALTARHERAKPAEGASAHGTRIHLVRLEGPIFFATRGRIEEEIGLPEEPVRVLVDLGATTTIDSSGADALGRRLERVCATGSRVWLYGVPEESRAVLEEALARIGADRVQIVANAVDAFERAASSAPVASALRAKSHTTTTDRARSVALEVARGT